MIPHLLCYQANKMQYQFTPKDYFLQLVRRYGAEIENVPDEVISKIKTVIDDQQLDIDHNTIRGILKDLHYQKYYQDVPYIRYRLTGKRDIISQEKKAALLKAFEENSTIKSDNRNRFNVAYYIRVELFCLGLCKIQHIYRDRCARLIQRTWDIYWYRPDEAGESKAAKASYSNLICKKTGSSAIK